ncbi:hypothetical protein L195_g002446, partial [Trifolium pratense]
RALFLPSAYLALMCLGYLEREKSAVIPKPGRVLISVARQGQATFLPVVEDNTHRFSL